MGCFEKARTASEVVHFVRMRVNARSHAHMPACTSPTYFDALHACQARGSKCHGEHRGWSLTVCHISRCYFHIICPILYQGEYFIEFRV